MFAQIRHVHKRSADEAWRPFGIFWRRSKKFGWVVRLQLLHGEQWATKKAARLSVWHRPNDAEIAWLSEIASVPPELRRKRSEGQADSYVTVTG